MYQFVTGEITASKMRVVAVEDLLGRDPIHVDLTEISGYITGKVVLVTGGGGSIGSELVRQIARTLPKQLIIFQDLMNAAYDNDEQSIRRLLKEIVTTYTPARRHGSESKGKVYEQLLRDMQAHK